MKLFSEKCQKKYLETSESTQKWTLHSGTSLIFSMEVSLVLFSIPKPATIK
jgi:hypothetical protein